jgi:hypothetical protein
VVLSLLVVNHESCRCECTVTAICVTIPITHYISGLDSKCVDSSALLRRSDSVLCTANANDLEGVNGSIAVAKSIELTTHVVHCLTA